MGRRKKGITRSDRFWEKVNKDGPIMPGMETPCYVWTGSLFPDGYGGFWDGSCRKASQVGYELQAGPIPDGLHVLHKCNNRPCVRGDHLYTGTNKQNMADRSAAGNTPRFFGPENGRWKDGRRANN